MTTVPRWYRRCVICLCCFYPWMLYVAYLVHGDITALWASLAMSALALGCLYIIHRYTPRSEE